MKLDELTLWLDEVPHGAALNMALDEAMLESAKGVWLRVYRWERPSLSIGFSQALTLVPDERLAWPLVRRWTGGGVVVHDGDWTYTLAAPPGTVLCEERAAETYRWIHEAMIEAMDETGLQGGVLQPEHTSDGMGVCFVEPAKFDVVWQGRKVAGAAQRRTKLGFLHQGSVQDIPLPEGFAAVFARHLALQVTVADREQAMAALLPRAEVLEETKYGTAGWTESREVLKGVES